MNNQRLTRAEATAELARRIWPDAVIETCGGDAVTVRIYDKPNETRTWRDFDLFNDRESAAALVAWLSRNPASMRKRFTENFSRLPSVDVGENDLGLYSDERFWTYLLATPEQIARAACAVLSIELAEENA